MFEIVRNGIFTTVSSPVYGKQDIGVTPGGVMDSFAYDTGNAILGNDATAPALEILLAPSLRFNEDCYFVITGAKYSNVSISASSLTTIRHGQVTFVKAGSVIDFQQKEYGFRSYLCYAPAGHYNGENPEGRQLGNFSKIASWVDDDNKIRVIEGPEFKYLENKTLFLDEYWKVSNDTSSMGMRLENKWVGVTVDMKKNMVSEAVSNGTIQLTPDGPIILLKHRQTVGGYPRIFNVISVDVDRLAQFSPGQLLHFRKVSVKDAHNALKRRNQDILKIKNNFK